MADNKQQASNTTGPTILKEIARCSKLKKHEYAPTQYDKHGKTIDNEVNMEDEQSYWEHFICRKQAAELTRRLVVVEADDYEEGQQQFEQMEEEK